MRGNVRHGHGMDVAVRTFAVIGFVGDLGRLVPVGGEDALAARALEREPEAANAAEEVYEAERRALLGPVRVLLPSDARRSGAVRRRVFPQFTCRRRGDESLTFPVFNLRLLTSSPTGVGWFPGHASTPLQSSAVVRPSALASLATFLMPGLRLPRSMSLM